MEISEKDPTAESPMEDVRTAILGLLEILQVGTCRQVAFIYIANDLKKQNKKKQKRVALKMLGTLSEWSSEDIQLFVFDESEQLEYISSSSI